VSLNGSIVLDEEDDDDDDGDEWMAVALVNLL